MAHKYLGTAFDIHGGGLDLIFPHHENEIAQAKAYGDEFARYWVHNAWVTMSGEKMSQVARQLASSSPRWSSSWRPIVLRYYLGTPHYRSMIEYSEEALREAESAFARIEGFVQRVVEKAGASSSPPPRCRPPSPRPWTTTWASRRRSPSCTPPSGRATPPSPPTTRKPPWPASPRCAPCSASSASTRSTRTGPARRDRGEDLHGVVDTLVRLVLDQREAARGRKDWATADAIRDQLGQSGLIIEDGPQRARAGRSVRAEPRSPS